VQERTVRPDLAVEWPALAAADLSAAQALRLLWLDTRRADGVAPSTGFLGLELSQFTERQQNTDRQFLRVAVEMHPPPPLGQSVGVQCVAA
jgi:hypothetical protein